MKTSLKTISVLTQVALHVPEACIEGLALSQPKIVACYVAKKSNDFTDDQIAEFFSVHPVVMDLMLKQMAINYLVEDVHQSLIDYIMSAYNQMQQATV